jgi:hypothetical protein
VPDALVVPRLPHVRKGNLKLHALCRGHESLPPAGGEYAPEDDTCKVLRIRT